MNKETNISQAAILAHALDLLCDKIMDADTGPDDLFVFKEILQQIQHYLGEGE